ncbi:response regulator transcription factor [Boseongicola sp. H5]|uniref:response regulator transcription factor n=1 Tax=Rhodobacterales TaxID=204455 RepID=UPI001B0A50E9|nr:response regulator [Boseongicola sp. H5]MBO6604192.1 response regulator [Roseicyclus sp.]MBO6625937.1 response regulator [Roseicyclus sp.]MBO6923609.1 response regulator [Roseicyclus sp.]
MGTRVLLVEDEANILEAISFILSRDGWEVHGHGNGATALDAVARLTPDVVVLDVMLPGRSGLDILRDLRNASETRNLPVLMLTAKGQAKDRDLALSLGANAYLTKPFSNAEMVETLRDVAHGVSLNGAGLPDQGS